MKKLNLNLKKTIVGKIKKYKMTKVEESSKNDMVYIPDMNIDGKPMFINSIQFNKLCEKASHWVQQ